MGSTTENDGEIESFAAIIVGSGQGGTPLATAFAKAGHKTLLIEASHIGGTCINEGCTPTKTMVASARIAHLAVRAPEYGVRYKRSTLMLEMETVRRRKREIVESFRSGSEKRLSSVTNLEVVNGRGRFIGERTLEITSGTTERPTSPAGADPNASTRKVTAPKIFLNVGCQPTPLSSITPIKNADKVPHLTSTTIMELGDVPKHLVIIGGGPIGIEFGQMFRRFGAKVSLIQRGGRLLPREDEDVSAAVLDILKNDGIEVYLQADIREVSRVPTGQIVVGIGLPKTKDDEHHESDGGDRKVKSIMCSHVLAAAGRSPNTANLGLENAGVEIDGRGSIKVNDELETSAEGVYSLGDVNAGSPQFTHISYDDFRILRHNLLEAPNGKARNTEGRLVSSVTYMDPQLGRVGETVVSARKKWPDRKLAVAKMPMTYVARALEVNETKGFMKGVVDRETQQILGFMCLGVEGGELMSVVQTAMLGRLTYTDLENTVFAHPTLAESLNNLWASLEDIP